MATDVSPGGRASADARTSSTVPETSVEVDGKSLEGEEDDEGSGDLTSLSESVEDYEWEHGRRYHGYKAGAYPLPNDESEMDRLDLQHHITTRLLEGKLHLAPLDDPRDILDIGTGTGIWA